jgi:hypothetical protein
VVAELVRHAPSEDRGLSAIGQALTYIRSGGVDSDSLILAAQLLAALPDFDRRGELVEGLVMGAHNQSDRF